MVDRGQVLDGIRSSLRNGFLEPKVAALRSVFPRNTLLRHLTPGMEMYPPGSIRLVERHGILFELDISDYPDWSLYFNNDVDSSRVLLPFVGTGDVFIDVGGNIGQTALMVSGEVGPGGIVISFEPFPCTAQR